VGDRQENTEDNLKQTQPKTNIAYAKLFFLQQLAFCLACILEHIAPP